MQFDTSDFLFVYDKDLAGFLRFNKKINYITKARRVDNHKIYWLFFRSNELMEAMEEWNQMR